MDDDCLPCPGRYCGRAYGLVLNASSCSDVLSCGGCPRGFRSDSFFCRPCRNELQLYDWLYLGFMALLIPVLHFHVIDYFDVRHSRVWLLHASACFESMLSFLLMVLTSEPRGSLKLYACGVKSLDDFYTLFFNPKRINAPPSHCTQEAVYPLYTALFMYFLFCFLTMCLIRGLALRLWLRNCGRSSFYAGLHLLPIVTAIHACLAGLLYYSFPYLVLVGSAIGVAVFFTSLNHGASFYKHLRKLRSIATVTCYCFAHGYGIISVTGFEVPARDGPLLFLVLFPLAYFAITRPFTNANNFKS